MVLGWHINSKYIFCDNVVYHLNYHHITMAVIIIAGASGRVTSAPWIHRSALVNNQLFRHPLVDSLFSGSFLFTLQV